ncbi:MAG: Rpn family recombination-promoting nuclease/putative transposase, partial [bacterium]
DVKTDFAFKKVFGSKQSKDILINFINSVVKFKDGSIIEDLTIVDPYQIPLLKGMKDTYVDVKAMLSDGSGVLIEMQILNYEGLEKRILYNAAKAYSTQLSCGDEFYLLNPIIAITITDFEMFSEWPKVISYFRLIEKDELVEYSGDIELIFIELPKFKKEESELSDGTDKWIYFIKNAGKLNYIPKTLGMSKEIKKAFEIANQAGLSAKELEIQHKRKDFIYIQKASISYAEKKGLEQGLEQGLQQGLEQGEYRKAIETAKSMYKKGVKLEMIAEITGLSEEEINRVVKVAN